MDEEFVGRIGNETSCFLLVGSHDTAGDVWLAEGQSEPSRFHQLPQTASECEHEGRLFLNNVGW